MAAAAARSNAALPLLGAKPGSTARCHTIATEVAPTKQATAEAGETVSRVAGRPCHGAQPDVRLYANA